MSSIARAGWMLVIIACVSSLGSCAKKKDTPPPPRPQVTTYRGVLAGTDHETATLTITRTHTIAVVAPSDPPGHIIAPETPFATDSTTADSMDAQIVLVGGTHVALHGSLTLSDGSIQMSGGGYSFFGVLAGTHISGIYSGPGHNGNFKALVPTSATPQAFLGEWTGAGMSGPDHATLALLRDGASATGVAMTDDPRSEQLAGTSDITTGDVVISSSEYSLTGSASGSTLSGTYTSTLDGGTRSGTWTTTLSPF